MHSSGTLTGPAAAGAAAKSAKSANDVQKAHGASPLAPAAATTASAAPAANTTTSVNSNATGASAATLALPIAPALHCQAAVVLIGETFGEFACSVFRTADADEDPRPLSSAATKRVGGNAASTRLAAASQRDGTASASASSRLADGQHDGTTVAAAAAPSAAELGVQVNCGADGVPRWELLVYAMLHEEHGAGVSGTAGSRGRRGVNSSGGGAAADATAADGEADDGAAYEESPVPSGATVYFQQTMSTAKLTKVVKLEAGRRYTVRVRCYHRASVRWSAWSAPIQTATLFPVETQIVEIGSDYVHCTWDRAAPRNEDGLARETDVATTEWARSIPDFELRLLRESDMAEHYLGAFEAGCRSVTIRDLQPGTRYIVLMRYRTVIRTMREWNEVTRLVTESPLEVHLTARGEDTFTFSWGRGAATAVAKAAAAAAAAAKPGSTFTTAAGGASDPFFSSEVEEDAALVDAFGYLQPRMSIHEYELTVESVGLRFAPITVPASVHQYTMTDVFPSTTYSICVRALSAEGRWGGRSTPLKVRTADRPSVAVAAVGESFASFAWSRAVEEEPQESQLQYRVLSLTSAYQQSETIDLVAVDGRPRRLLNVEHLRSDSDYTVSMRIAIAGTWGLWTEPRRFTTAPSVALTFLERGEDFLTLNWPSAGLAPALKRDDGSAAVEEPLPVYNVVVVKVDDVGERTAVLNERVTRDPTQRGFRVNDLEADTTYDVQCRTWQRNPMTGFEGWGELSAPVRMRTLQPVALHVWDVGEDFIHIMWRRGLSESATATPGGDAKGGDDGGAASSDWDHLKYEVVMGCADTGEDSMLHRQVLDTSYTVTQLKPSTTYTIAVRACDEQGQWGLWSRVKVRTLASVKTTIHEIGEDFVRLVWQRLTGRDDADLRGVTVADMFVAKYSILVYGRELPGIPVVPHVQSGYEAGGGRSDIVRHDIVSSEHTSLRVDDLLPDREYVAVVRAATSSGRWGLWSQPVRFRTNPQFRIPTHQLTIGENYVNVAWSRGELETPAAAAGGAAAGADEGKSEDGGEVQLGDWTVTGQELRISGVTTQYAKQYALDADVRELKVCELLPACAYIIQIRVRGRSGSWGLWSAPASILTRGTLVVTTDEVAEDFVTVRWERRKVANPHQYPTGRGVVTSYHLRVYNTEGVRMETFLGDGDCPYRVTGLKANTYYCVELKANYNDEEWGLWSVPLWCLTMQPMRIQAKLISEEFCCLQLIRPNQQRRLPEDDGNPPTDDRVLAHGKLRPTIMLCVTSPILSKAPYNSAAPAAGQPKSAYLNDALPPDAAHQRLIYQTELLNSAETVEHTVPNLKCNTVYSVSVRTKLANGEWGMWSPSLVFATVPATRVSFTSIGESFVGVEWVRHSQVVPPQIASQEQVVLGVATITASRVRVRESGGAYQHTYTVEGATNTLRIDNLTPATTYMVCVQTFNDNYEWGVWSEEQKVRTVPGMDIHVQHVSEDALWVSWSRRTDLHVVGDANTAFNVNIAARAYEVCLIGEGGFTYTQETDSTSLFFRGLMPDAVYTIHVRALFAQSEYWGLWSAQPFRTKPRLRVTFGNIGEHFVMLEWRRHLPKPTDTDVRLLSDEDEVSGGYTSEASLQSGALVPARSRSSGAGRAGNALMPLHPLLIAETKDVVQLYRFKVQRVGESHSVVYNIAPTVSGFRLRDLQPSSEYRVWVCAKGYEGVWGFWSEESRVRTLPRLTLEVLNIGEDYVRAQWRRGAWEGASMAGDDGTEVRQVDGAVSGYEIRVIGADGSVAAMSSATFRETSAVLSGLRLSTRYAIQVRAKDTYDAWGLWSDPISFYTLKPVLVALQRVGETFVDVQWARPMHLAHAQHDRSDSIVVDEADEASAVSATGMHVDEDGVLQPDERVTRWHMRVTCNRVFAGMPQTEDYRELYADEGDHAMHIDGLLPQATYSMAVRGLNHAGEWGHWSPALVVVTCPLLKVAVEVAGETFLQLAWNRPTARGTAPRLSAAGHSHTPHHGYLHRMRPHRAHTSSAHDSPSDGDDGDEDGAQSDMQVAEGDVRIVKSLGGRDGGSDHANADADVDGNYSALPSFVSSPAETYLCFPSEAEVHNYQVTIKPMPAESPFDEADEPLVDGARVYETTQPGLRLGNLLPGTRYAITVREQQSDDEGRLVTGEWGAPSEAVCTLTVPPVQVIPQEIGEDYCMVEWRRAAVAEGAADGTPPFAMGAGGTGGGAAAAAGGAGVALSRAAMLTAAASTTASQKAVEFQLQTRRIHLDGTTLYEGPLAMDSVVSVPSSVNTYHIAGLAPSSVYEVRVRAKMENAQWGMWSPATRFMTQSRLELRVDRVQEVTVRVSWCRPRLAHTLSGSSGSRAAPDRRERSSTTEQLAEELLEDSNEEVDSVEPGEATTSELGCSPVLAEACGPQVIQPDDAVHEYELVIEGISVPERRRVTFSHETQFTVIEELQQEQLYCLSIRSLSEKQHWSRFSAKVTLLTLSSVVVRVAQHTECTALLEWSRPAPDVGRYAELLARHQRDALHQCDDRERRELLEMKRKIQEQESKGESTTATTAGWMNPAAREEHNALLREEATRHYQADRIAVGHSACTGYELRVTMQRGELCVPYIAAIETLRAHGPGGLPIDASAGDLAAARRSGHTGPMSSSGGRGTAGNTSFRERKRDGSVRLPPSPGAHSGASLPVGSTPAQATSSSHTLLSVQLRSCVTQVLLQGLSPDAVFSARVRARGVPDSWQPWSRSAKVETLPLIQLDQSRFGEHYINLYWYRGEAAMMASVAQEAEEFRRLQREFHNLTERGLEEQRNALGPAAYASLVNRLRRLRILRRLSAARAKRHADGETGLLADPACPVQGYQLRVIDEAGTISEHYLPNNQFHDPAAPPTLGFTATGLQPNSLYVCCLCPHYGGDVWGCWTAPLKYMTHNIIQLDITYISETFVDLEWWRLDNKPVSSLDEHDTLLSSRYTEEVQVYQLRITHEDAVTGQEVEEFRNMRACNVLRIDALLPDMKYTIAVREWDPKGDWGLWSASCSCVTLPSIETTVTDVKECSAQLSWRRATPRIDYENDMHVLEDSSEIIGFYLRMEEVPKRVMAGGGGTASPTSPGNARPLSGGGPASPAAQSEQQSEANEALSMSANEVGMLNTSFHNSTSPLDEKPRAAEADELEGTLAFGFQRGGPLPPEAHPQLFDGLVSERADGAPVRQHYLLVKRITSSTELQACLADLHPQTVYQVQIMAETTGGQVGPWSPPHFFITVPQLRLSAGTIDEHYVSLQWLRRPLGPIAAQIGSGPSNNVVSTVFPSSGSIASGEGSMNAVPNAFSAPAQVTLPTARVVSYELEVRGAAGQDFVFSTRIDSGAANGAFRVTGLTLDSAYVARVRSVSDAGEASLWSAELTFVTLRQLLVQPQEITESTIEMSWSRPEQKPELYLTRTSFDAASATAQAQPPTPPPPPSPADAARSSAAPVTLAVPSLARSRPVVCVGDREAVKYQVRVYHATEQAPPRMLVDKQLNGNITRMPVNSLIPNSVYLLYVRAINRDGVWSEWSEGRCVYTMKPLFSSIATVGEDFVRVQWARDAPEELHYTPGAAAAASTAGASTSSVQKQRLPHVMSSVTTVPADAAVAAAEESGAEVHDGVPLVEDDGGESPTSAADRSTSDSPNAARTWLQGRRFRLHDRPSEVGGVYCSAATAIQSFTISVRRSDEAEGYTVEVPGHTCQHTLPGLQPDSIYLICVRAQYSSGERGPWSDIVRSGTYNLLAMDVKEVGEDYVAASWQRKSNTIHMASLHIGKVEETVCYEVRVRDYTEVPLGEEESDVAQRRDSESRSVFLHANQRHSILRELLSNHRYRLSVRRWYQPHDGFSVKGDTQQSNEPSTRAASVATSRNSMSNTVEGSRDSADEEPISRQTEEVQVPSLLPPSATPLQLYAQTTHVVMDAALRESMERAKALPGVWSDSEYVVTLRDMVCSVERVGEEYFQLRWGRDPRAVPLPVRRAMPVKPVQNYQLRIDELLRDGSGVEGTRSANTLHLDGMMAPTETSYFSNTLKPNTLYKIEVRCCIEKLWGRWSRPVYVITQPCLQVEVSRIGEECATIAWHRPREPLTLPDGEVAILGDEEEADGSYQLEVNGIGFNYQISRRFKASRTSYTVRHLDADALYAVRVRSGDGMHQACSLWSETSCFATLKPIQVVLSMPTEQFVHVEWSRPPQTAEEYAERLEQQAGIAAGSSSGTSSAAAPQPSTPGEGQATGAPTTPIAGAMPPAPATTPSSQSGGAAVPRVGGTVQLGNPGSLAFHLCVFNTQETPSLAVVDKQFHKDVSHHRVVGLVADTPYVVIVRACCEATGDWGLWSEERHFRTLKLLAPTVSSVGETYAELTWEHSDAEQLAPGAGAGAPAVPTKYLLVLRSTRDGTFEREITAEECRGTVAALSPDNYQAPSYRLTQLHPGTEYAVALQPCYGGGGDWGLWSQAAAFTTLQAVQLTATLTKDAMDLSWGRSVPVPSFVASDGAGGAAAAGGDGAVRGSQDGALQAPPAAALPAAGSHTAAGTALANSRTVSRYQLVVYREEDIATAHPHGSSLEASLAQPPSSSSLFFPNVTASQDGRLSDRPTASSSHRSSSLRAQQRQLMRTSMTAARLHSSLSGPLDATGANSAQTAIPDMDVGAGSNFDSSAAMPVQRVDWLFRKQYDVSDAAANVAAPAPATSGASGAAAAAAAAPGGPSLTVSGMHERIEGLTPDTTYLVRLRAMDLFGHWGTPVEVRLVTPPLAPMQVALRRVNGQFCSLQWTTPGVAAADGAAGINAHGRYRYIVEQCVLQTEPGAAGGSGAPGGAAGGGIGGGRKAGGPNAADWHVVDTVEDTNVCAVRISGLLSRMRCRVKCARHIPPAPQSDNDATPFAAPAAADPFGPYSDYSEVVAVSGGTPPEGVVDPHLSTLSQNAATLEWLPPPKPSEAAAGRYARPVYHVYLANTTDQPYPVQIATVHRPTYVLTNLTPATTYTVQVVAENADGVSFRNPILRFTTKAEDDQTVSRHDEGGDAAGGAAEAFVPLAEIVPFHGPRAAQAEEEAAAAAAAGADVADIPTAARRSLKSPTPPTGRQRGGRASAGKRGRGSSAGKRKGGVGRKASSRGRAASGAGAKRSSSGSGKPVGTETVRENVSPNAGFLPPLAKTM